MSKKKKPRNKTYNPNKTSGCKLAPNAIVNNLWFYKFEVFISNLKNFGTCDYVDDKPVWIDKVDNYMHSVESLIDTIVAFFTELGNNRKISLEEPLNRLKWVKKALYTDIPLQEKYLEVVYKDTLNLKKLLTTVSKEQALNILDVLKVNRENIK